MIKQILSQSDAAGGATLALILFFIVMCGSVLWTYRKGSRQKYETAAKLPLNQDTESGVSSHG
ncbi:MAG: cbb3-type cytochrome oxidase subunit 3 [Oligoflexales bacterium]